MDEDRGSAGEPKLLTMRRGSAEQIRDVERGGYYWININHTDTGHFKSSFSFLACSIFLFFFKAGRKVLGMYLSISRTGRA